MDFIKEYGMESSSPEKVDGGLKTGELIDAHKVSDKNVD